jgi:hypothetical protein
MKQTKFLFDNPVTKDWLFWVFVTLAALSGVGAIQRVNESGGVNTSTFSLLSGSIDALFVIFSTYIFVIPIYLIRRFIRKKNKVDAESADEPSQVDNDDTEVESLGVPKIKSKRPFIFVGAAAIVLVLIQSTMGNSSSEGDRYFEIEQSISAVVKDWNIAVTPLSEAILGISDGSMGAAEARGIVGQASSEFAVITNRLEDACRSIPEYDINAPGEDGAFAKAYDALQVTCDLLPQESTEALLLISEQISPIGTQANIDYHSNEIAIIVEKKRKAILDSLDAMMPYLSEAQKENAERMRVVLTR